MRSSADVSPAVPEDEDESRSGNEMPEALKDLRITENGILIDEKTGKEVNEFGATRWDVAVRALRGELDPPQWQGREQAGLPMSCPMVVKDLLDAWRALPQWTQLHVS